MRGAGGMDKGKQCGWRYLGCFRGRVGKERAVRLVVGVEEEKGNLGDPRVWLDQLGDCWCHLLKWERQVGKWILLREGIMSFWSRSLI